MLGGSGGTNKLLEVTVGDGRLRAAKDVEGEAPIGLLVSASVILSTLIVGRRRVTLPVSGIISGRPGPARVTAVAAPVASTRVSAIGSARVASLVAPRGVHLLLAELFELPAVADVVGVPSMEEAERLARSPMSSSPSRKSLGSGLAASTAGSLRLYSFALPLVYGVGEGGCPSRTKRRPSSALAHLSAILKSSTAVKSSSSWIQSFSCIFSSVVPEAKALMTSWSEMLGMRLRT